AGVGVASALHRAVKVRHCITKLFFCPYLNRFDRRIDHLLDFGVLPSLDAREHELCQVPDWMIGLDPQPHAAKLLGAQSFDYRLQTLLAARAALTPHPDHAQRQRDIIANYDQVAWISEPIPFQKRP